ncbi:MAG: VWA domain-containing protein [Myxococcota bacterium]|nr:VWA domain-containing protein [Myxococcota bacterium]
MTDQLAHPEWLWPVGAACLAAAACLGGAAWRADRTRRRLAPALADGGSRRRDAALLVSLLAIGVALLGPRLGEKVVRGPASGLDVVLLLDTSRSMDASDVAPSRLARARRAAGDLLARLEPGDRAALAVFASRGVMLTPLTPDHGVLAELLDAVDTSLVQPAGSHLGGGVRAALSAFEAGSERPRVMVVLSDGEDPERRSDLGIGAALAAETKVLAAAFGTASGAVVPDHGVPLRGPDGAAVVSRRRSDRLERLASATGGVLLPTDPGGALDGELAMAELRRDAGGLPGTWVERRVRAVQVFPFAALAFLLLAAEALPRGLSANARSRPRGRLARRRVAAAGAALVLLAGAGHGESPQGVRDLEARLAETPRDTALLIELGVERLAQGRRDAARRAFLAAAVASSDPSLAALAYFDLGVAALEAGDLEDARDAFFDALALDPDDREARFNLEWTLKALPGGEAPAPPDEAVEERAPDETPERSRSERAESGPDQTPCSRESASTETLGDEERRRWLGRVRDDLGRALHAAARSESQAPRRGPAW